MIILKFFLDSLIDTLGVTVEISDEDLQKIPEAGPFITVSNHPFGGLDGIILVKILLCKIRPDYKVLANFLLKKIVPIQEYFLGMEPREEQRMNVQIGRTERGYAPCTVGQAFRSFPCRGCFFLSTGFQSRGGSGMEFARIKAD